MNKRLSMVGITLLIIAVIYSACAAPAAAPAATPAPAERRGRGSCRRPASSARRSER